MGGFASMARQAAATAATFNQPRQQVTRTASGVSPVARRNVSSLFATAKKLYAPGGEFMAGIEASISRGSKRAVASGVQQLASAGLAGTSIVGGLGKKYEEEIGMPARAQATTARLGALAGLLQAEAGAELQMASRYGSQTSRQPAPAPSMAAPYAPQRPAARQTTQPQAVQPIKQQARQPLPPNPIAKSLAPAGQWQGTIGGTSFYSTGTGRITQTQTPVRKPLSSYYDIGGELGI